MRIDKKLGIRYPLIQGGMANIATGEFAAAVSNAGALGLIGAGGWTVEQVEEQISICKKLTDKPFGVNLMLMNPQAPQIAELLANEKIAVITTGAGNPAPYMEKWKANGSLVMPVMTSTLIAKRLEAAGADYIIAEGTESGGHVGEMTTMAMIPQMVDALNIPVIAAGGIADGRGFAAAMMLGAEAVQIGTRFVVADESIVHNNYKEKVVKAKDIDSVVTGMSHGHPVRAIRNQMTKEYLRLENEGAPLEELELLTLGALRKAVIDGDVVNGTMKMLVDFCYWYK